MKYFLILLTLAFTITVNAQDEKTVTLVVSGQGKTQEEAKQNALRSAIEQAFGVFISSNTEILNDELVKDEIVSVSNGNIQKFEVLSEVSMLNGKFATILRATVSISKLTSFVESKGATAELKGGLFAMNIKQQKLNEEAESKAVIDLCEASKHILKMSLDFTVTPSNPKLVEVLNHEAVSDLYSIDFIVKAKPNQNFLKFHEYFLSSLKHISMSNEESLSYKELNKQTYTLGVVTGSISTYSLGNINDKLSYFQDRFTKKSIANALNPWDKKATVTPTTLDTLKFRNEATAIALLNFFVKTNKYLIDFKIESEIGRIEVLKRNIYRGDDNRDGEWRLNCSENDVDKYMNSGYPRTPRSLIGGVSSQSSTTPYHAFFMYSKFMDTTASSDVFLACDQIYLQESKRRYQKIISVYDQTMEPFIHIYRGYYTLDQLSKINEFIITPN